MDTRTERVVLETGRHLIEGSLVLPREGYRSRLSDFLNRGDVTFIPLTDALIRSSSDPQAAPIEREFLAVGLEHVHLAYPLEDDFEPSESIWAPS